MQRLETLVYRIGGIGIPDEPYPSGIDRPPRERADSSLAATTWRCQEAQVMQCAIRYAEDAPLKGRTPEAVGFDPFS